MLTPFCFEVKKQSTRLRAAFQVLFLDLGLACISLGPYSDSIFFHGGVVPHTLSRAHILEQAPRTVLSPQQCWKVN